jgi:hypothetical protein
MAEPDVLLQLELAITSAWRGVGPAYDRLWACNESACQALERGERPSLALAQGMRRALSAVISTARAATEAVERSAAR